MRSLVRATLLLTAVCVALPSAAARPAKLQSREFKVLLAPDSPGFEELWRRVQAVAEKEGVGLTRRKFAFQPRRRHSLVGRGRQAADRGAFLRPRV